MPEVILDGATIRSPEDFYAAFFDRSRGVVSDYGGRNLDALADDLRDLVEPLVIVWRDSAESREVLGDWFDQVLSALTNDGDHPLVEVQLSSA